MIAEIYTTTTCRYCTQAKMLLKNRNVDFNEYVIVPEPVSIYSDPLQVYVTKEQLLEKAPNAKSVPQIWLDGNYIGGYNELAAFFNKS